MLWFPALRQWSLPGLSILTLQGEFTTSSAPYRHWQLSRSHRKCTSGQQKHDFCMFYAWLSCLHTFMLSSEIKRAHRLNF